MENRSDTVERQHVQIRSAPPAYTHDASDDAELQVAAEPSCDPHTAGIPPCLIWQGARTPEGYGRIKIDGRFIAAHRVHWERAHGPIPAGLLVLHLCDRPACVNVDHLVLGTQRSNMFDRHRKSRGWFQNEAGLKRYRKSRPKRYRKAWSKFHPSTHGRS